MEIGFIDNKNNIIGVCRSKTPVRGDVSVLRPVRTEYGKQIRKSYESHSVYEKRKNMDTL